MKLSWLIIFLILGIHPLAQKKAFIYYKAGINKPAPDERNLDFSKKEYLTDKRSGAIVFRFDAAYTPYFDFFNDRYIIIKQIPLKSILIHSPTTLLVPMMNTAVIDMENPQNIFVFNGNSKQHAADIKYYRLKKGFLVFYFGNTKLKFKRKQSAGYVSDW